MYHPQIILAVSSEIAGDSRLAIAIAADSRLSIATAFLVFSMLSKNRK